MCRNNAMLRIPTIPDHRMWYSQLTLKQAFSCSLKYVLETYQANNTWSSRVLVNNIQTAFFKRISTKIKFPDTHPLRIWLQEFARHYSFFPLSVSLRQTLKSYKHFRSTIDKYWLFISASWIATFLIYCRQKVRRLKRNISPHISFQ